MIQSLQMKYLFYKLPQNLFRVFYGRTILWHSAAIVLTVFIVTTGFDWQYFLWTRNTILQWILFPAIVLGGILPFIVPLGLVAVGKIYKNKRTSITGWALGQAALLGSAISSLYKIFTGRIQPDLSNVITDTSHGFQFGFWRHGVFWGWPSSHTTIAFAMSFCLIYLYPKNKIITLIALIYAYYVGIAVSTNIHWFSEFVAGALIGRVIGKVVGNRFKKILKAR